MSSQLVWASRRIADLEAENARLQERGDGYKSESEVSFAGARRAEAQSERRGEALGKWLSLREHLFKCRLCLEAPAMCHEGAWLEHEAVSKSESALDAEQAREKGR